MLGEKLGEFQDKVTGRRILSAAASMLCLALVLFPIANVRAAELQILAGGAMTGPLGELATQFESASGHKLVFRFGTTPELIKLATTGGPFDLGIVPVDVMKDAAARVRFASGPTTNIARVGLGIAVRSGAHKPDIGTPDALKQTLLDANPSRPYRQARLVPRFCGCSKPLASARRRKPRPKRSLRPHR
jgi:molybdate transport system substrate-binding protein